MDGPSSQHNASIYSTTVAVRFMPGWIGQYSLKVPAVLKGGVVSLAFAAISMFTDGAPVSTFFFIDPSTHAPFSIICGEVDSFIKMIASPFLMVIVSWRKLAPINFAV